ncbi:Anaphase-promoting complex subunit 4 [Micractinium conductrix]|uniref:Anaphase-promoting complex subunit 4 n=1 Tax=Micractinium conductrix TaxID=554055 RepID=A0A2P6VMU2_9CHLO|nr:Anaphase-promoting complex subunit 4 [Micractinium conductrix]|eukprot:PSC75422.1 Anaphase-promoting complex subunit 4 [Micractinium conductrix]
MEEAGRSFTSLLDRGLTAEGSLAAWCPTRDLLALATADGQLHLHRLNWQRLWWNSPEAPITALEWRPDGKQLVVGMEDGSVALLNAEDGEVALRASLLPGPVVSICWTEAATQAGQHQGSAATAAGQLAGDRTRRVFAPPPPPMPTPAAGLAAGYATCGRSGSGAAAWPPEPARLAVLACASADGKLALCSSLLFPLARLHLPDLFGAPQVSVLRLAVAPSLQQLTVVWQEGPAGGARLATLSTCHVGAHAQQLHRLALAAGEVGRLLDGCRQSHAAAAKEWACGQREFDASRARLAALMGDYGCATEPASELHTLLATGAVGGALQQYLTSTLGEPGLKKLARAVDAAVVATHNLLTDHLQPALEQLAFRLGELRGLALCLPWRRITGLHPEQVGAAEQAALALVLRTEAVRRQLVAAGAQYRTFFSWLLMVMRRMQEDAADALVGYPRSQLDAISSFLALQFRQDSVGPLLGRAPEGSNGSSSPHAAPAAAAAAAAAAAGSGSMLHLVMAVLGRQEQVQAADSTASPTSGGRGAGGSGGGGASSAALSLGELLASVQAACSLAFDCTAAVVSPTVQLAGSVALGAAPAALAAGYVAPGSGVAAAVAWEGQQHVLLLRGGGDEQGPAALEAALLQLPEGAAAADLAFYKEGQVALLLAWEGGCRLALLPQEQLGFVELPAGLLVEADALQLCEMLLSHSGRGATPLPPDCRQRALPYPRVQQPLAVSASRGVGCVLAGTQRVLLYDLEEEEDEEDGGEEEEEELVDAHEGQDMDSDAAFESPLSR